VELIRHLLDLLYPYVVGEGCVQGPVELLPLPAKRERNGGYLPGSVDPAIGAAGPQYRPPGACEALQSAFQLALDRSAAGLELPTEEIGPVVVDGEPESTFGIWGHADKVDMGEERSRKAWTWSYLRRYPKGPLAGAFGGKGPLAYPIRERIQG
jgi:hypothetical protein